MVKKPANLEHLQWAIDSRARNQRACVKLLTLFEEHENFWTEKLPARAAENLLAIAFSLWRSAFLANKTGSREQVFAHGREFLIRLIEDNAISYAQDKSSLEWTFNYYTKSARSSITILANNWPGAPKYVGGTRKSRDRWDYCQDLLEEALTFFENHIAAIVSAKAEKAEKRASAEKTRQAAKKRRAKVREMTLAARLGTESDTTKLP